MMPNLVKLLSTNCNRLSKKQISTLRHHLFKRTQPFYHCHQDTSRHGNLCCNLYLVDISKLNPSVQGTKSWGWNSALYNSYLNSPNHEVKFDSYFSKKKKKKLLSVKFKIICFTLGTVIPIQYLIFPGVQHYIWKCCQTKLTSHNTMLRNGNVFYWNFSTWGPLRQWWLLAEATWTKVHVFNSPI